MESPVQPAADKLQAVGPVAVRHEQYRGRRPIISFIQFENNLLKMAFSAIVGLQTSVTHRRTYRMNETRTAL